ncbi:MAG TPA: signal peptidase I [Blastocatellia bacterium]|jgi:signal peptidase I|nr:signal peptidase I [Blastocatellia bacterium]
MRAYDGIKAERGREVTLETPDFLEQARQLLSRSLPVELRMSGSSMRPAIEDGDVVTIEPIADEPIRQGDIVLYHSRFDTAVIHRVVRIDKSAERSILTRGDSAAQNDLPVSIHRILGRVKLVERAGERIDMIRPKRSFTQLMSSWFERLKFW